MKCLTLLTLLSFNLLAQNIYVVASTPIQTNAKEIKKFFLAKSNYLDGKKYKRVSNEEALESLASTVYNLSAKRLSKKWIKENFRKGTPFPLTLKNNDETIAYILHHDNAVGFISTKSEEVYTIFIFKE